ncbi:MAG: NAD(P)-binding protein [Actinobacteria bacterium]|nr:NAD(P)-binding protein [Actinomycetota bacterium]MCG2819371.1 NAD(P)-binding protein [Actinomycetes bacterium]MBU4179622.1 NAD(P)-binding protein [Actinomycetota bacterium]MBU4218846.1 NAD(P)-binding protein [Actinomycetota bacterium]MBU4358933.1 NAD(P)-binding protein [Actinomycetota bacterium]
MKPKQVLVIGAGVGEAAVAALLQRRGHGVTLLERKTHPRGQAPDVRFATARGRPKLPSSPGPSP